MNIAMLLDIPASIVAHETVLHTEDGSVTYGDLRAGAAHAARLMREEGIASGDSVGLFGVNSAEYVMALFGAAALGAVVVPMNYRAQEDEARHLATDSGVGLVLADERYGDLLSTARPSSLPVRWFEELTKGRSTAGESAELEVDHAVDDATLAVLMYTSGTTSLPKGVRLTHGGLSGFVMARAEVADGTDRGSTLLAAPLYHVAGLSTLLMSVYSGRRIVLVPQFDARRWLATVEEARVTHAFVVPTMLAKILDDERFGSFDLSSLETIAYGAAPMPRTVIARAVEAFPDTVQFTGAYGLTETTSTVAVLGPDEHRRAFAPDATEADRSRLASAGRPVDGVEVRIDAGGEVAQAGAEGEVLIRTGRSMTGYWGDDDGPTKVSMEADDWLRTGDLGYLDEEGYLFLTGRASDMIIRGGENVAPAEVEAVIREHPAVADVAVFGMPDEEWGELVAAAVVLIGDHGGDVEAIAEHCRRLATFKRPDRIEVVDELPRTSTGKIVRRVLVDRFVES